LREAGVESADLDDFEELEGVLSQREILIDADALLDLVLAARVARAMSI
jgi:hypothetical protein